VLEDEPSKQRQRMQQTMYAADGRQITWPCATGSNPRGSPQDQPLFELESIRARLERLLPNDS
jgi:hypothetical protein